MWSLISATVATGRDMASSTGMKASVMVVRARSTSGVSALPKTMRPTDSAIRPRKVNRWANTFNGAAKRNTRPGRFMCCLAQPSAEPLGLPSYSVHADQNVAQRPHLFEATAGAERHAGQRIVGHRHRQAGGVPQH